MDLITKEKIKERGWTESMIKKLLVYPDTEKPNPYYKSGSPMKLYSLNRIEKIEKTDNFKNIKEKMMVRKMAGLKSAAIKREKALQELDRIKITVKAIDGDLFELAINSYNNFEHYKEVSRNNYFANYITESKTELNPDFLHRITCNYIRHNLIEYDGMLEKYIKSKVGRENLYNILKKRIHTEIKRVYPFINC